MQFKKRKKKKSQFSWREGAIIAQDKAGHDRLNPVFDIRESKY